MARSMVGVIGDHSRQRPMLTGPALPPADISAHSRWASFTGIAHRHVFFSPILCCLTVLIPLLLPLSAQAQIRTFSSAPESTGGSQGQATVSPDLFTGTLSNAIPIEVPPGTHGVSPSLTLTYSSSGGGSPWLGTGWALETGSIERRLKDGLKYNGDDYTLHLDGGSEDLVRISGSAPGDGEFRVKIGGDFNRIKKIGSYWEVTDKSGRRYLFGQATGSRQDDPNNATRIFKWCLDQVIDIEGNSMTLSYFKDTANGQIYPDHIDYSGNRVTFYRELKPGAPPNTYTLIFKVTTAYRIKTIDVVGAGSGNHVRTYKLNYTPESLLSSVQLFGKDATPDASGTITNESTASKLPATVLTWDIPPASLQGDLTGSNPRMGDPMNTGVDGEPYHWFGDLNGDGIADSLYWNSNYTAPGDATRELRVQFSSQSGFQQDTHWGTMVNYPFDPSACFLADVDGDGKQDFVYVIPEPLAPKGDLHVMRSSNWPNIVDEFWGVMNFPTRHGYENGFTPCGSCKMELIEVADVNRDGKADLIYSDGQTIWVKTSNGATFSPDQTWGTITVGATKSISPGIVTNFWLADVDGDGRLDFVACLMVAFTGVNEYSLVAKYNTGSSFSADSTWVDTFATYDPAYPLFGDINNDGKLDILVGSANSLNDKIVLYIITGDYAFAPIALAAAPTPGWLWFTDMNGDGMADIVYNRSGTRQLWVRLSTGSSFAAETLWGTRSYDANNRNYQGLTDMNGDGKPDLVYIPTGSYYLHWFWSSGAMSKTIKAIDNGLGGRTTIGYAPSTQYTSNTLFPIQTVKTVTVCDNYNISTSTCVGISSSTNYTYHYGYYHQAEQDFRGFNFVEVRGPLGPNGVQTIADTYFHQGNDTAVDENTPSDPVGQMKGKPYRLHVMDAVNHILTETTTIYAPDYDATAAFFHPVQEVDTYSCDGTSTTICGSAKQTETRFVYDCQLSSQCYGNLMEEEHYGEPAPTADDYTVSRTFTVNETPWLVGLPATETVYSGIGTGGTRLSDNRFYYDNATSVASTPSLGHLTKVERWLDTSNSWLPTTTTYDSHGNPSTVTDALNHTTTNCYDAGATYLQNVTQPQTVTGGVAVNHIARTDYYGVGWNSACGTMPAAYSGAGLYGQVKSVTNENNQRTGTQYDTLGRLSRTDLPDGTWTTQTYNNLGTVGTQNLRTDTKAGLWSETYYDGLGRPIKERAQGSDGTNLQVTVTQTAYNNTGTVLKTSLPYFESGGVAIWNAFTYDALGRMLVATSPDGSNLQNCYNVWTSGKIDPSGHLKQVTQDAAGHPLTVKEYTGAATNCASTPTLYAITQYQYDSIGRLIKSTDSKGNKTTMRYDSLGRKLAMADPDMGSCGDLTTLARASAYPWYPAPCWNYDYDAVGNLLHQRDAKGQTITFTYDALNRIKTKTVPATGDSTAPSAPGTPSLTVVSSSQINLSWSAATDTGGSGLATYRVERCQGSGCANFAQIATVTAPTTSYNNTGLAAGTSYSYRVRAVDAAGNLGAYSASASATTTAGSTQPDLVMSAVTPNAATVSATGTLSVTNSAKNQGTAAAGSFTVGFKLAPTASYDDANAVAIATTRTVSSLAAGAVSTATTTLTIPLTTPPGPYFVCAKADTANTVTEGSNEGNNTSCSGPGTVTMPAADLIMTQVTPAATAVAPGKTIVISTTAKNQGAIKTGSFTIAFHLSTNSTYGDVDDVALAATRSITTLAAGATSTTANTTLTIPAGTPLGSYYICALADSGHAVNEGSNENNNSLCSALIHVDLPDMVMTAVTPNAATVNQGATLSVTNTIKNQGLIVQTGTAKISFKLSVNNSYDDTDIAIATYRSVTSLAPGASNTATTSLTIAATTPPGTYYLCAKADSANGVIESHDDNNTRCSDSAPTIKQVTVPFPDLAIPTLPTTTAATVVKGKTFSLSNTVKNQGGSKAGAFTVAFSLSGDAAYGGADDVVIIATRAVSSLAIGATSTGSSTLTVPATTPSGIYHVCMKADSGNTVVEGDESNNTACTTTTITVQ